MKKIKEFLCFVAAFVLLINISVTYFMVIFFSKTSSFVGGTQYIRLLMADSVFSQAIFNTFLLPTFFGLIIAGIFTAVVYFLRHRVKISRLIYYIGTALITSITVFLFFFSPSAFRYISLWDIFFALYIGLFTTFVFWLVELIFSRIKKRAVKKNVTK